MATLLHLTADLAVRICEPHRAEVAAAAEVLGLVVREVDVEAEPDCARAYEVLNVPVAAIEEQRDRPPLVGARGRQALIDGLRDRL
jgi:hypothetical protein